MNVRTETTRSVHVETSRSTMLKITRTEDAIVLAHGLSDPFRRPEWCGTPIRLPVSVLPELRRALEALEDE